ncbi:acetyl-CoA synthetase-like protein [Aspergillus campestris IBT 28561]|uniref:Acetyl-CoA synthetase-like protein n=1 Tax=Aspergillus campestris (strain IBT 28561) TaxID=1392248 RepID=A0A2I1DCQ8_ASPC2|nr:acetyl-CoA synthetase-like protein [Aspergillus campestris IBT 28561]PKY07654.1 acetyl-CoA synthetase-like protein [Aspergillus campestris IBT 28561]
MVFTSTQPRLDIPTSLPIWDFLFDSDYSPLRQFPASQLGGYVNAITKEEVRYDALKELTTAISTALVKRYGLEPGQTIALFSPNTIWYPVAMLATVRVGGIISGASPAYNVEEMAYALKTAHARFLMTVPSSLVVAVPAAAQAGIPKERIFLLEGAEDGYVTVQQLIAIGRDYSADGQVASFQLPVGKTNQDICGFLSFSSGTTGLPKAVDLPFPEQGFTGLVHQMHLPILLNSEVYMLPSFSMKTMLDTVVEYHIRELLLVPPILIRLLSDPIVAKYDLSHVERFFSGAAPIAAEVLSQLQARFPHTGFKQGYGMTESCSCITAHPPDKSTYAYATRGGVLVANTEVKVLDVSSGDELGVRQEGEIVARGPQVVMGYLGNEKATRETFSGPGERWLHTGDVGFVDEEGFVTITDRIKEMIKVKGVQVSPAELEDLLLGHEAVDDVAVTAVTDDYAGEKPKAYVVLAQGSPADIDGLVDVGRQILEFVRARKVRDKWLVEVEFVDEVPKSASGKILRRVLRDRERNPVEGKRLVVRDERTRAKL